MNPDPTRAELASIELQAAQATRAGKRAEALQLWRQVLASRPDHLAALTQVAQAAYEGGDFEAARLAFGRAADAEPRNPRRWVDLATTCQRLGDAEGEEAALSQALVAEPRDLLALLMRGQLQERLGQTALAASSFGAAVMVAPPIDRLVPELKPLLQHAMRYGEQHRERLAAFVSAQLEEPMRDCAGADLERFRLSLDILLGRKRRYEPQPLLYYYPHLEPVEFFERKGFPWLDALEAGVDDIRAEFMAAWRVDAGFTPYVEYSADQPLDQWAELNHSPRWSVLHLVKGGLPVPENASRCPETMRLWSEHVPGPVQRGRAPVALFSVLKPRTHIPAHTGASNVRLLAHLPLVVPPNCRFRVGNTVREWVPGRAWVFDDTMEHEAWNDSEQIRVVMIFDHWHPALSPDERRMITALAEALSAFSGGAPVDFSA